MTLDDLFDRYGEEMYRFLALRLGSPQDAEDVLQEIFCRLARYSVRWAFIRNPRAFVFAVLRNESRRFLERTIRRRETERRLQELPARQARTGEAASDSLSQATIEKALSRLPGEQQEILLLKIVQGFSFKEIARICDLSPNTTASRYRYGLQKLQSLMEGKNDQGTDA